MKTSRFISLLLCVVMIMSLFTGLTGPASADDVITHEVQSGEILMKICEKYGLNYYNSKNAIMQLNGFTSEAQLGKLTVGQKLKLPASSAIAGTVATATVGGTALTAISYAAGAAAGGSVAFYLVPYTVKNGDTLNKICNELGSNYYYYSPVIQGINALANPNQIHAGQVLLIPTASAAGATSAVVGHVVQAGETITSIANQYGLNYQVQRGLINGLNRRDNMDKIYVGQTVLIPSASVGAGVVAATATTSAAPAAATTSSANSGNYQISISGATNGSPYAVVNNVQFATRANAGETVNIVPSPKAGYAVRDIQVIRTDSGTDIPISNYSFTMPNSSVQVTVFYSRGFVINKVASPYGTFDAMIYGTNANTAFFGDEITLAIYPKKGYNVKFPSGTVTGVYYQKSDLSMERVYVKPDDADGLYRFKMPNYEIRLTVEYVISKYFSLTSSVPSGGGSVVFTVDGVQTKRAMEGQTVIMQMVPSAGWTFDSDTYEKSPGFDILNANVTKFTKVNNTTYRFVMGSVPVGSGEVRFINNNTYGISTEIRGGEGSLVFQIVDESFNVVQQSISRAKPNQLVEVIAHPHNKWAFTETGDDSSSKYMLNMSMGKASHCQVNGGAWPSMSGRYIFRMPAEDVNIVTKFIQDTTKAYYEFKIEYASNHGLATAFQDGKPVINHALADPSKPVEIKVTANDNYRATGVLWIYTGNTAGTWIGSRGDSLNKTWNASFTKHTSLDTVRIYFEEFTDYTTIAKNEYKIDTRTGADDPDRAKINMSGIVQNAHFKVGDTINFTATSGFGYTVGEVWLKRDGNFVKLLAPTEEGGNNYRYTVTAADCGKTINFLAVRKGTEPRHYIIPEYTIADTGITNVNGEPLYTVEFKKPGATPPISQDIGPVYGMGATKLVVEDRFIKSDEGVWVRVTIPKTIHKYDGVGTTLYYQVDTLTIRFSDYVLDNYKILDDGTTVFTYDFWYKADDPITDLNIMVNYKEVGTDVNAITPKTTIVTIDGQKVVVTEISPGKYEGKITIGGVTSTVKVEVT